MNPKLTLFTRQLLFLWVITGIIIAGLYFVVPRQYISPALPFLPVFFMATTLLSFRFLQKKMEASPRGFVTAFMANSMIRLLLYLAVIVVYALISRPDAVNFIISFFLLYVIFTAFEISFFLRKV